jgi:hypothetical protein
MYIPSSQARALVTISLSLYSNTLSKDEHYVLPIYCSKNASFFPLKRESIN